MSANPKVDQKDLPSLRELHRATVGAAVVAAVLLAGVVLPAERGLDPTGVGGLLGLTALGKLKTEAAPQAGSAAPELAAPPSAEPLAATFRTDELELPLQPGEGAEIKAEMRAGDQLIYHWAADQGELFFDFHGEPKGAPSGEFTSFEKGTSGKAEGVFEAPFEGVHGWYWKNKTETPVIVQLKTSGVYQSIGHK